MPINLAMHKACQITKSSVCFFLQIMSFFDMEHISILPASDVQTIYSSTGKSDNMYTGLLYLPVVLDQLSVRL